MIGAVADVAASVGATALTMTAPGIAALAATHATRVLPIALWPAAAVTATVLVAAPCLILVLALQLSIVWFAALLGIATIALAAVGLLRRDRSARAGERRRRWRARGLLAYGVPTSLLVALAAVDAPHVRSDTFWHVALARKLAEFDQLSSAQIAFGAGTPGNSSYPLPAWHALLAIAERFPLVDVWFASWFLTLWAAPIAMYAFGAVAGALVGHHRATLAGSWVFLAIVVLGYGPWFFASRYLGYPGQIAIFVVLPIVVWAFVRLLEPDASGQHRGLLFVLLAGVVAIGVLHANYVLYPSLFALGAATLMLLGARERAGRAFRLAGAVVGTGALTLGAQLPWIMHDANFLRGDTPPDGAPSAFIRHRDVLAGSEELFWVKLGSLAAQPWLVVGALAIPLVLAWMHRRVGPWVLAGGAVAIVVTARVPWIVLLVDAAGSITPVTRFDRVYPAAVGVLAVALLTGHLLQRVRGGRSMRVTAWAVVLAACAVATWWVDSIRDTRRIVVTPFVEARWVGGLDPSGIPLAAVWASSVLVLVVAIAIRRRARDRSLEPGIDAGDGSVRYRFATAFVVAIVVGLAPASVDRAQAVWEPQAYDRTARHDRAFVRIEVYPVPVRREVLRFGPGSVVLADVANVRRVASLVPVFVVGESIVRELEDEPVTSVDEAAELLDEPNGDAPPADYLVANRTNAAFSALVEAARSCGWTDRSAGGVRIFERVDGRC